MLLILVWMVAGLQFFSAGQNPTPQNPPVQSPGDSGTNDRVAPAAALSAIGGMQNEDGTEDTNTTLPQIPALLGGKGITTAVLSEMDKIELPASWAECGRDL